MKTMQDIQHYTLMHKNIPVLEMRMAEHDILGGVHVLNKEHLPFGVTLNKDGTFHKGRLKTWLNSRTIPDERDGLRELLYQLQVPDIGSALAGGLRLSLSDHYWTKPDDLEVTWEQVNFFDNPFSPVVGELMEQDDFLRLSPEVDLQSPDLTTDGALRKRWVILDGERCLIKRGTSGLGQEPYNEVVASMLMERLEVPHIPYRMIHDETGHPKCVCPCMCTRDTELIPVAHFFMPILTEKGTLPSGKALYTEIDAMMREHGVDMQPMMDRMLTIDFLMANEDRHLNNFGVLRDADTLKWIKMAPVYDTGYSLGCRTDTTLLQRQRYGNLKSKPFNEDPMEQMRYVRDISWLNIDVLRDFSQEMNDFLKKSTSVVDSSLPSERIDAVCRLFNVRVLQMAQLKELGAKRTVYFERFHEALLKNQRATDNTTFKGHEITPQPQGTAAAAVHAPLSRAACQQNDTLDLLEQIKKHVQADKAAMAKLESAGLSPEKDITVHKVARPGKFFSKETQGLEVISRTHDSLMLIRGRCLFIYELKLLELQAPAQGIPGEKLDLEWPKTQEKARGAQAQEQERKRTQGRGRGLSL